MLFSQNGKLVDLLALKQQAELSDQEWQDLLDYSIQVWGTLHDQCSAAIQDANSTTLIYRPLAIL